MEKAFPKAWAGALCPDTSVRVRWVEFPWLVQITLTVLEFGVPGLPPGRHSAPETAGVQVLHRSLPNVPPAHASPLSSQTHCGVPAVHGGQRRHPLHLYHKDLPLAGQHGHTEVYVVKKREKGSIRHQETENRMSLSNDFPTAAVTTQNKQELKWINGVWYGVQGLTWPVLMWQVSVKLTTLLFLTLMLKVFDFCCSRTINLLWIRRPFQKNDPGWSKRIPLWLRQHISVQFNIPGIGLMDILLSNLFLLCINKCCVKGFLCNLDICRRLMMLCGVFWRQTSVYFKRK